MEPVHKKLQPSRSNSFSSCPRQEEKRELLLKSHSFNAITEEKVKEGLNCFLFLLSNLSLASFLWFTHSALKLRWIHLEDLTRMKVSPTPPLEVL